MELTAEYELFDLIIKFLCEILTYETNPRKHQKRGRYRGTLVQLKHNVFMSMELIRRICCDGQTEASLLF